MIFPRLSWAAFGKLSVTRCMLLASPNIRCAFCYFRAHCAGAANSANWHSRVGLFYGRWTEGMLWSIRARLGAVLGIMKLQIDWLPLKKGAVHVT